MLELLIVLTVVEVLLVLAVLLGHLLIVRDSLRRTAGLLAKTAFGVRAIETQAGAIGPSVVRINAALEELGEAAPRIADGVDQLARP